MVLVLFLSVWDPIYKMCLMIYAMCNIPFKRIDYSLYSDAYKIFLTLINIGKSLIIQLCLTGTRHLKNNEIILSNFQLTFNPRDIDLPFGQCIILYIPDKCLRL